MSQPPFRVFLGRTEPSDAASLDARMSEALGHIRIDRFLSASTRVMLKPNFTWPHHKPGVTTSPAFLESVVKHLRQWTRHITIVESNGGANAWPAERAFEGHGVPEICRAYDVACANFTMLPRERATTVIDGRETTVELASAALHECDLFVTLPVPKLHVMTGISLALKNQWGCLPDVRRLRNHPQFRHKILAINKLLRTRVALFDGTWFLDRTGPLDGDAVPMNLLIASDDPGAGSRVVCDLMGVDPATVPHKKLAMKVGMLPRGLEGIDLNAPLELFRGHRFRLRRTMLNHVTVGAFHSRVGTWFLYNSVFAKPLHEALYLIRGRPKDVNPYW